MRRIITGDQPVTLDPVAPAVKFITTLERSLAVGRLLVAQIANAVVFLRFGTWYLLNMTRIKKDGVLHYQNLILILVWVWREPLLSCKAKPQFTKLTSLCLYWSEYLN